MDTELLRTFLELRKTRHFAKAADNLFITQAAVSARIRQLETLIGQPLFTRGRNNIQLTQAGYQLVPYAESILNTWSRALMDAAAGNNNNPMFSIGCVPTLREILLDDTLAALASAAPRRLLQIRSLNPEELLTLIRERAIGLGVLYDPPRARDIWAEPLATFEVLMVASKAHTRLADLPLEYIYLDWGATFAITHSDPASNMPAPGLWVDSPRAARQLLLQHSGAAYLAYPLVAHDLTQGALHRVEDAPVFERSAYLIGNADLQGGEHLNEIRSLVQQTTRQRLAVVEG